MNHGTRQLRLFISFNTRAHENDLLEAERHNRARFERLERRPNDVGVRREEVDEFARFRLGEEVGVDLGGVGVENDLFCDSALDGTQTGVCVLEVRASVAVPGGHSVDVEVV